MLDTRYWDIVNNSRISPEQRLALAVILQGMEDFLNTLRKPRRYWKIVDYDNFNWPYSEAAEWWCEAAGVCVVKLRKWADEMRERMQRRIFADYKMKRRAYVVS